MNLLKNKKIHFLKLTLYIGVFVFSFFGAKTVDAATLYFSPSSGTFTVGNIFNVSLLVNTQGQDINNVESIINFPTNLMEVTSISKSSSVLSLWVEEPNFSNSNGTISFNGGLPTPGYNGSNGNIINVVFRAKKAGIGSLISNSDAVRANDGLGTDVLTGTAQASFTFIDPVVPKPTPVDTKVGSVPQAPNVSSPTHPDPDKWYAENTATFTWSVEPDVDAVKLLAGQIATAEPTILYTKPIDQRTIEGVDDGIWYFHAQLRNNNGWSDITHFRFQIDTQKPTNFDITEVERDDLTNPRVKFVFDADDETSGIDYYEVQIDEKDAVIWQDDGSGIFETSDLPPGKHTLFAKVFDKAGNSLTNSIEFVIEPQVSSSITGCPSLILVALIIAILLIIFILLIILILWYSWHKFRTMKNRLRKEVNEAKIALHKTFDLLKETIHEEIKLLEKVKTKRKLTIEEEKIIKKLKKDLDAAEKSMEKEIKDIEKEIK